MSETNTKAADPKPDATITDPVTPTATGANGTGGDGDKTVPIQRLSAETAKLKGIQTDLDTANTELQKFRDAEKLAEDDKQKAAGDVTSAQAERDAAKEKADRWETYAQSKIDSVVEQLDEGNKSILTDLKDMPLDKQLSTAEKLLAGQDNGQQQGKGFGSKGGPGGKGEGREHIPADVKTPEQYQDFISVLNQKSFRGDQAAKKQLLNLNAIKAEAVKFGLSQ